MPEVRLLPVAVALRAKLAVIMIVTLFSTFPARAAGPDYFQYQVAFPAPPADGVEALNTLDDRAIRALTSVACGSEFDFLSKARAKQSDEDITNFVIGKMDWFGGHHDQQGSPSIRAAVCRAKATLSKPADITTIEWDALRGGDVAPSNAAFVAQFGLRCGPSFDSDGTTIKGVVDSSQATDANPAGPITVNFTVSKSCMWDQINAALFQMAVVGQMGTDGLRCMTFFKKKKGDWDMSLRNLTRIIYLDKRYHHDILRTDVRNHIRNSLLTADGASADETYSLLSCGNTEESTGTAEDRADERSWVDDLLDSLGEFLSSLLTILLIILAVILIIVGIFFPPAWAGAAAVIIALGVAAAVVAFISTINIPETENHLLMINSSKYLNNQLIIKDLRDKGSNDDADAYQDDQDDLKEWFLEKIQKVLNEEFIEYNSRPYSRLTIGVLYNFVDFADDDEVRVAAQMALDFTLTKYFVGSHESRRFVPFRRQREAVRVSIIDPVDPNKPTGLFDQVEKADHLMSLGLFYSGQTQQLPPALAAGERNITFGAARNMLPSITSFYRPEAFLLDLAINKQHIYQRFKYDSAEVYSSGPGFLISAGGVTSGLAYTGSGIEAIDLFRDDAEDDLGTALPTIIFLSGAPDHTTLDSLIRIQGKQDDDGKKFRTWDHNVCVWGGFACGLNLVVPGDTAVPPDRFQACVQAAPVPAQSEWGFIDTGACPVFSGGPRQFVVIYREACRSTGSGCGKNFGFVEVVEAGSEPLPAFIARIVAANPKGFIVPFAAGGGSLPMSGVYHSARGEDIHFSADAHQNDSDKWGIISVNGAKTTDFDNWDFARGDVFTAKGDGIVRITNPATGQKLELDMSDANNPKRKVN